ncbi:hypothetical protein BOM_1213 (plasmid) [Borrelia miyamotoi FR64b]|uniref:Uncharacterized protein n=1 Tax=Borrelia miyamotoi FR64b TaxID=1292392 RepID=W5SKZ0_9SPIR|nr:hypothetical protein BOM_1213 [Borrelia miyamotoi FR64b]
MLLTLDKRFLKTHYFEEKSVSYIYSLNLLFKM